MKKRIAFIDSRITDYQYFMRDLSLYGEVIVLNSNEDGLDQVASTLKERGPFDGVDIFSHGASGTMSIGASTLTFEGLDNYKEKIMELGSYLSDSGDIFLYGCNIAQGSIGQTFIQAIAKISGADVAASTDLTGASALGGDWVLEAQEGSIELPSLEVAYDGVLTDQTGTAEPDSLNGTDSDDYLFGGAGNDRLNGLGGNDSLYGEDGSDALSGGDGNDSLVDWADSNGVAEQNSLDGGAGDDHFYVSSPEAEDTSVLTGGDGSDVYHLQADNLSTIIVTDFTPGAGGDIIDIYGLLYSSAAYVDGNPFDPALGYLRLTQNGSDALLQWNRNGSASGSNDWQSVLTLQNFNQGATPLTFENFVPRVSPNGSSDGLTLAGDANDNILWGSDLNDNLSGLGGNDALYGEAGHDTLEGGDGYDSLYGGRGDDILIGGAKNNTTDTYQNLLYGQEGNDTLIGGDFASYYYYNGDNLFGGAGNDSLNGLGGNDLLYGEDGSDALSGGDGNDSLHDWVGNNGVAEHNSLDGGAGDDHFYASSPEAEDTSVLTGGDGSDVYHLQADNLSTITITDFTPGAGGDIIDIYGLLYSSAAYVDGNPFDPALGYLRLTQNGNDTVLQWNRNGSGAGSNDWQSVLTLQNFNLAATPLTFENFTPQVSPAGNNDGLTLVGDANNNTLWGSDLNDKLSGLGGSDVLHGEAGHDALEGGEGYDILYGGRGDDILIGGIKDNTTDTDRNWLYGEDGNDILIGGDFSNYYYADYLVGGSGNDSLSGLGGNDSLYGNDGSDTLSGGDGNDSLYDWADNNDVVEHNVLDGGAGDDHFYVSSPEAEDTSVLTGGDGSDVYHLEADNLSTIIITDFTAGAGGDVIDINDLLNADNSINPFDSHAGSLRLRQDGVNTILDYDQDGKDGSGQHLRAVLTLENVVATSLTSQNFDPAFAPSGVGLSSYRIDENSPSDTVIGVFDVFGPNFDPNQTYTYALLNDSEDRFIIVGNELRVANGDSLNFEEHQTHTLSVSATSGNGAIFVSDINILLSNVNEAPTDLNFTKYSQASVADGAVVGYISTTDPDWMEKFTYSLVDNADGRFELVGNSLKVTNASLFDDAAQSSHSITIQVTDASGLSFSKDLSIELERLPDLVVTQVTAPQTASSGESIELSWTVTNQGSVKANGKWTDTLYLDVPDTWWKDLNLGSFSYTGELAPGASLTRVQQVKLPIELNGSYQLVVVTDANHELNEGASENNNTASTSTPIEVTLSPRPNLQVSSVFAPSTIFSGKEAVIQWTVTNNGTSATDEPSWHDSVWLSLDDASDETDIYLGAVVNPAYLNVGESYTSQLTVKLPEISGAYRFVVKTDTYSQVFEADNENDNAAVSSYTEINPIPLSEMPDLVVPKVSAPTQAFSGQSMTLNFTLSNQGEGRLQGEAWPLGWFPFEVDGVRYLRYHPSIPEVGVSVYMSSDSTLSNEDTLLATDHLDLIYRGGNDGSRQDYDVQPKPLGQYDYKGSINVGLPVGVSGDFYYFVTVKNLVGKETSTLNNTGVTATPVQVLLTPPPDLEVSSLSVPTAGVAGHEISVTYQVGNFGLSTTPNHYWSDQFYLSQDAVLNRDTDISLQTVQHSGALNPDGTYSQTLRLTLPNGLEGRYYLFAETDDQNQVFELDNTNNYRTAQIDIASRPADLVVSGAISPTAAIAGQAMRVSWSVINQGVGDTISGDWSDQIILSRDQVLGNEDDVALERFSHGNEVLNPGGSYQRSELFNLPISLSGNYFVFAKTDVDGQVFEGDEQNNQRLAVTEGGTEPAVLSVTQVGADLQTSQIEAPQAARSSEAITVNWTTTNAGAVATNANYWTDRVVLSRDEIVGNGDDIVLGDIFHSGQLEAGSSYEGSIEAKLPIDLDGDYHLFVTSDVQNNVFEAGNDSNNTLEANALLSIELSPAPDVQINRIDIPASGISGQRLQVSWTVTNNGAAIPAQIDPVTGVDHAIRRDTFYLSRDQVFDPLSDKQIGTVENLAVLDAGASQTYSASLTLPRGLSGNYYLFAVADSANHIYERGGENNNTALSLATVNLILPPPADLAVGEISVPASAAAGQAASIAYTVTNVSGVSALGEWEDALYLSADAKWDVTDTLFARIQNAGPLASGESYSNSVNAAVPGVVSGDYHIIVRSDIRNAIPEPNEQNNTGVSTGTVNIGVEALGLGLPDNGQIREEHSVYYRIEAPAGESLRVDFDALNGSGFTELYVSYGQIPSRSNFDFAYENTNGLDQSVIVPNTRAGSYYVLAYGERVDNLNNIAFGFADSDTADYEILADVARFEISEIGTTQGSNLGETTIRISGTKFTEATDARLVAADGTEVFARQVQWKDGTELWATFDLRGKTIGQYDVKVLDGGQLSTLDNVFKVTNGPVGNVVFDLETPQAVRPNQQGALTVHFKNVGQTDSVSPVLQVALNNALLRLPTDAEYSDSSIQFLAVGTEGPAGILSPGESGSITLMFKPTIATDGMINASVSALDKAADIDWASTLANARPEGMSADGWNAIIANFTASVGDTAGSYQQALADSANRLSLVGESTNQISRLFGFEFARAANGGSLVQQNQLGVLGWGRAFSWDIAASEDQQGVVELRFGDSRIEFQREADGSYSGSDTATLSKTGGVFTLRQNDGTSWVFQLDGKLDYVDDANGNRIDAIYTGGHLTELATSTGDTLAFSYNAAGRISTAADQTGRSTRYTYDATGEYLTDVTSAAGTVHYDYVTVPGAAQHAVSAITYPDGSAKHFQYDVQGRLVQESLNDGAQAVRYAYDSTGGVTVTDAEGNITRLLFNDRGQIERIEDALHRVTQLDYDRDGNLIGIVNPDGTVTAMSYDMLGNPLSVLDAMGNQIQFAYHPTLNALSYVKDQLGHGTGYGYDAKGNLQAITYADGSQDKYSYDSQGNLTVAVNQRGENVLYTYDSQGQLLSKTYPDGSKASYAYDARGNLIGASDADSATSFEYDGADRLTKVIDADGRFLAYTYDAAGHRASMTDQAGNAVHYGYNALGQLASLTDGSGNTIASYRYDDLGRLARGDNGNGTYTTYDYDAAGQLTHLVNYKADGSVNSRFDYTYDEAGNRSSMTTLDGTTSYEYDAIGQLTGITLPEGRHIEYQYDAAGNRTQVIDSGTATDYSANELNQYTRAGGASFTYDADGNQTSKTENGVTTTYAYDVENRLVSVSTPTDTWSYEYDALGNRIASVHNGERTEFQLDPTGLVNVAGEYDSTGHLLARYTHGLGLEQQASGSGGVSYYDFDAIGSTAGLTAADGAYINQYRYLPFGENLLTNEGVSNAFEYVGQWGVMDEGNGLHFMRQRYYGSTESQFIQTDPIGTAGGINLYKYVEGNPINFADPTGLVRWLPRSDGKSDVLSSGAGVLAGAAGVFGGAAVVASGAAAVAAAPVVGGVALVVGGVLFVKSLWGVGANSWNLTHAALETDGTKFEGNLSDLSSDSDYKHYLTATDLTLDLVGGLVSIKNGTKLIGGAKDLFGKGKANPFGSAFYLEQHMLDQTLQYGKNFEKLNGYLLLTQTGVGAYNAVSDTVIAVVVPRDPNDILGPKGFGDDHWVKADTPLGYTIRFENMASATAPAQRVTITQNLDSDLDLRSFRLGDFGWGDIVIDVPENRAFYSERLDFSAEKGFLLDVVAGIDVVKGQIFWTLTTIDPTTGEPPVDPLLGFLPPNNGEGAGDGFVQYRIKPSASAATGTRVDAAATIVFDTEAPIDTPAIFHTLDASGPASQVLTDAEAVIDVDTPEFQVRWSGGDTGSALAGYTVYVSDNGGEYLPWLENTTLTEASYLGQAGHTYAFYSVASDNAGNREATPDQADLTVSVKGGSALLVEAVTLPASGRYAQGDELDISVRFSDVVNVNLGKLPPAIALTIGTATASAHYLSGSGTNTLVFRHTVQADEYDADGVEITSSIVLNDSVLTGTQGNGVDLALGAIHGQGIVINNAPQLALSGFDQTLEGADYQLSIQLSDADTGQDGLGLLIDWGDGSGPQNLTAAELVTMGGKVSHRYADGNSDRSQPMAYTITVIAEDALGVQTQLSQNVIVGNVAPAISVSGLDKVDQGKAYRLDLGSITDPGLDTVSQIVVDWGDGTQNIYNTTGPVSHVFTDSALRHISVDLVDEDGYYSTVAQRDVAVYATQTLGNAPTTISKSNPNGWINAWSTADVSISHKDNYANAAEAWSVVTLNGLSSASLTGGDIYGGDLGVSGKSLATSSVAQEIDGSEALRLSLAHLAHEARVGLSRLFINDDGVADSFEAGRLQAFRGDVLVGETVFNADSTNGQKMLDLNVQSGFDSLVFSAGSYDDAGEFISGAYVDARGQFASAPSSSGSAWRGSDYLVDSIVIGVRPDESFFN